MSSHITTFSLRPPLGFDVWEVNFVNLPINHIDRVHWLCTLTELNWSFIAKNFFCLSLFFPVFRMLVVNEMWRNVSVMTCSVGTVHIGCRTCGWCSPPARWSPPPPPGHFRRSSSPDPASTGSTCPAGGSRGPLVQPIHSAHPLKCRCTPGSRSGLEGAAGLKMAQWRTHRGDYSNLNRHRFLTHPPDWLKFSSYRSV